MCLFGGDLLQTMLAIRSLFDMILTLPYVSALQANGTAWHPILWQSHHTQTHRLINRSPPSEVLRYENEWFGALNKRKNIVDIHYVCSTTGHVKCV